MDCKSRDRVITSYVVITKLAIFWFMLAVTGMIVLAAGVFEEIPRRILAGGILGLLIGNFMPATIMFLHRDFWMERIKKSLRKSLANLQERVG